MSGYLNFFNREMPLFAAYAKEHYPHDLSESALKEIELIIPEILEDCSKHGNSNGDLGCIFFNFFTKHIWLDCLPNELARLFRREYNRIYSLYSAPRSIIINKAKGKPLFERFLSIEDPVVRQTAVMLALRAVQFRTFTPMEDAPDQWRDSSVSEDLLVHIRDGALSKNVKTGEISHQRAVNRFRPMRDKSAWVCYSRQGKVTMPYDPVRVSNEYYEDDSFVREIDTTAKSYLNREFFKELANEAVMCDFTKEECLLARHIFLFVLCKPQRSGSSELIDGDLARYYVSRFLFNGDLKDINFDTLEVPDCEREHILSELNKVFIKENPRYKEIWGLAGYLYNIFINRYKTVLLSDGVLRPTFIDPLTQKGVQVIISPVAIVQIELEPNKQAEGVTPKFTGHFMFKGFPGFVDINSEVDTLYLYPRPDLRFPNTLFSVRYSNWDDDLLDINRWWFEGEMN